MFHFLFICHKLSEQENRIRIMGPLDENLDTGFDWRPTDWTGCLRDGATKHHVPQPLGEEVPANGQGAGLAEAQVATRLEQNCHLRGKAHLN